MLVTQPVPNKLWKIILLAKYEYRFGTNDHVFKTASLKVGGTLSPALNTFINATVHTASQVFIV